MQMTVVLATSL